MSFENRVRVRLDRWLVNNPGATNPQRDRKAKRIAARLREKTSRRTPQVQVGGRRGV